MNIFRHLFCFSLYIILSIGKGEEMTFGNHHGSIYGSNEYAHPPTNVQVLSGYEHGVLDLRWDNPVDLFQNSNFNILGVNIYRSLGSERGPYFRINQVPISSGFFRDKTSTRRIVKEVVTSWTSFGSRGNDKAFILRSANPIHKSIAEPPYDYPTFANKPSDVSVYVDGVEVLVDDVFGRSCEVRLVNQSHIDPITQQRVDPVLPSEGSTVEISYWTNQNFFNTTLDKKVFYRITTVALSSETPSGLSETPLAQCQAVHLMEVESLDYIWREAIRRNNWILEQGGERVKVFVRKTSGTLCNCRLDERQMEYSKQPSNTCRDCFGVGFVGGYEGPYEAIVAPDDSERRINQTVHGRRLEHVYEVWTGPTPTITMRDFIVKQTNERYSIGPVRRPSNRGNFLQQHFNIGFLDSGDIRYSVPINGTSELVWPETRDTRVRSPLVGTRYAPSQVGTDQATPMGTDKDNIPDGREKRGRSRVWENQNY